MPTKTNLPLGLLLLLILLTVVGLLLLDPEGQQSPLNLVDQESEAVPTKQLPSLPPELASPKEVVLPAEDTKRKLVAAEVARQHPQVHVFGRVVQVDGEGLGGIPVFFNSVGEPWSSGERPQPTEAQTRTTTDAAGNFEFTLIQPDSSWISLSIRSSPFFARAGREFGIAGGRNQAPLEFGENDLGDFVLAKAGAIDGMVVDHRGIPIEKATVTLKDVFPGGYSLSGRTAADGTFRIGNVPAGNYVTQARADGYLSNTGESVHVIDERAATGTIIALDPAPTIRGLVVDRADLPLADIRVWGWPKDGGRGCGARTAPDGTFQMNLPQDEPYSITIEAKGFPTFDSRKPRASEFGSSSATLAGQALGNFPPGSEGVLVRLVGPKATTFLVVDATTGAPVETFGLVVDEVRHEGGSASSWRLAEPGTLKLHPAGVLVASGEPAFDDYAIHAPGYGPKRGRIAFDEAGSRTQTIRLHSSGSIHGTFLSKDFPIPSPSIALEADFIALTPDAAPYNEDSIFDSNWGYDMDEFAGLRRQYQGQESGTFEISNLAAGTFVLTLTGKGVAPQIIKGIQVRSGEITDLGEILALSPSSIRGVAHANGVPMGGITVALGDSWFADEETMQTTSQDGSFDFIGLAEGTHWLWFEGPPKRLMKEAGMELKLGKEQDLFRQFDLSDRVPAWMEVHVSDRGQPIPNASITVTPQLIIGSPKNLGRTNDLGVCTGGVPANNTYVVEAQSVLGMPLGRSDMARPHAPETDGTLLLEVDTGNLTISIPNQLVTMDTIPHIVRLSYTSSSAVAPKGGINLFGTQWKQGTGALELDLGPVPFGTFHFRLPIGAEVLEGSIKVDGSVTCALVHRPK